VRRASPHVATSRGVAPLKSNQRSRSHSRFDVRGVAVVATAQTARSEIKAAKEINEGGEIGIRRNQAKRPSRTFSCTVTLTGLSRRLRRRRRKRNKLLAAARTMLYVPGHQRRNGAGAKARRQANRRAE